MSPRTSSAVRVREAWPISGRFRSVVDRPGWRTVRRPAPFRAESYWVKLAGPGQTPQEAPPCIWLPAEALRVVRVAREASVEVHFGVRRPAAALLVCLPRAFPVLPVCALRARPGWFTYRGIGGVVWGGWMYQGASSRALRTAWTRSSGAASISRSSSRSCISYFPLSW